MIKRSKFDIALEWAMTAFHLAFIPFLIIWLWNN